VDRDILERLAGIAGVNPDELAEQIFSVGSPLLTMSAEQAITADCKPYEENGHRFSVAQIEELTFAHFDEKQEALLDALGAVQKRDGLLFSCLLVTDINTQTSLLLVQGMDAFLRVIDFPLRSPHIWHLAGIVSRKKQLLPYLIHCVAQMSAKGRQATPKTALSKPLPH
jgi:manganese-dependent inorganic pyrophosphatase